MFGQVLVRGLRLVGCSAFLSVVVSVGHDITVFLRDDADESAGTCVILRKGVAGEGLESGKPYGGWKSILDCSSNENPLSPKFAGPTWNCKGGERGNDFWPKYVKYVMLHENDPIVKKAVSLVAFPLLPAR